MDFSIDELRTLARTYVAATGAAPTTLSRKIVGAPTARGGNDKIITRLLDGHTILMTTGELVSRWFVANWPTDVPWPLETPQPPTVEAAE